MLPRRHDLVFTERRQETGSENRRLATARASDERHELRAPHAIHQVVDYVRASEEPCAVVDIEREQTLIRTLSRGWRGIDARRRDREDRHGLLHAAQPVRTELDPGRTARHGFGN